MKKELTTSDKLEEARKQIHRLSAAAAAAATAAAGADPVAMRELPAAYRTVAAALQTKIAAMCISAAEVEAVLIQIGTAWGDCLSAQAGGCLD